MNNTHKIDKSQEVISLRIDATTSKRIATTARRMQSSKSCIVRLALARILDEADRGQVTLAPEKHLVSK